MNQSPLLSIIVPVYNSSAYLPLCLESIVTQSEVSIEVILIDDGSTDLSGQICDKYSEQYPFIKTFHQSNQGVAAARNAGLRAATGTYLFFVDNDDWLNPGCLAKVMPRLAAGTIDIFINTYLIVEGTNHSQGNALFRTSAVEGQSNDAVLRYITKNRLNIMAPWEYIVRRELITSHNLSFSTEQNGVDDSVFTPILFCHAQSFALNDTYPYSWRQRPDSQGKKHQSSSYITKMMSTISNLEKFTATCTSQAQIDYLHFSIYKNLFSLYGDFDSRTPVEQNKLRDYLRDHASLIKTSARASGLLHSTLNHLFGNFFGLILGYRLATIKGRLHLMISQ